MNINEELKTTMMLMMSMICYKFVLRPEPQRILRVQPVYRPSAFPEARLTVVIIEIGIDIVFAIIVACLVDYPFLYSTSPHLDFHLLRSTTKLKEHSRKICYCLSHLDNQGGGGGGGELPQAGLPQHDEQDEDVRHD